MIDKILYVLISAVILCLILCIISKFKNKEYLGSGRSEPDFWEIGQELSSYKYRQTPHYGDYDIVSKKENFSEIKNFLEKPFFQESLDPESPAYLAEERKLRDMLWIV